MNKNTKEDCEMKKEEYLSLIDEVIALRSGMQEISLEFLFTGVYIVFRHLETSGIPEICM